MPIVQRTAQAEEDLINIWFYIATDNPKAADGLLEEIEGKFVLLAEQPRLGPADPAVDIRANLGRHLPCFFRVSGQLSFSVHVAGECQVAGLGQQLGSLTSVIVQPPPLVDNQHSRPRTGLGIVPGQEAAAFDVAILVSDLAGLDLGRSQGGE